ncbi:MAG: hypothetical protein ACQETE_02195 [Bacteroidota bacterium]
MVAGYKVRFIKLGFVVMGVLLLSGCMSVKYEDSAAGWLDGFVGQDVHYAILELGPPEEIKSDGRDGKVYIWETVKQKHSPGYEYTEDTITEDRDSVDIHEVEWERSRRTEYHPPKVTTKVKYIQLFVQPDKTVYHYRHNVKTDAEKRVNKRRKWLKNTGWTTASSVLILLVLVGATGG